MEEKNGSMRKKLSARYGSGSALRNGGVVVLRGQRAVTVYGCRKILLYSPREICLCVEKRELSVVGENLLCTCFSAGSATVEGCIEGVFYKEGCKRWREDGRNL
ncbi:MAG: YabP/YqfC family sporulation protein [Clostridia bacterium]|nr:YabP/YqfC family sporulation protein [Clostridia bacterium]